MSCNGPCPREQEKRDPVSPGPVTDDELIARAAFDSSAGSWKKGKITLGIVSKNDLFADKLSVWRLAGAPPRIEMGALVDRMKAEEGDRTLFAIAWASALEIRRVAQPEDGSRALCVLDECDTDFVGGKHPAHAHIALCKSVRNIPGFELGSPAFIQIHRDLATVFRNPTQTHAVPRPDRA